MAAAEIPSEFSLQGSTGQHIQIVTDGFMRDPHHRVVRIPLWQTLDNLFGRPAVLEQVHDGGVQVRVDHNLARLVSTALCPLMGGPE